MNAIMRCKVNKGAMHECMNMT
uniref:Uncharacterized protein n=1 Tax=Arundo donax TaxID=35708 RepID=A0A0A8XXE5_ARUDO